LICENIVSFRSHIHSVVKVSNSIEEAVLSDMGIKHVINEKKIISDLLADKALACHLS
jgi:Trk K+ transport system NAD-binding subunit